MSLKINTLCGYKTIIALAMRDDDDGREEAAGAGAGADADYTWRAIVDRRLRSIPAGADSPN